MEEVRLTFKYSQEEYVKAFRQHLSLSNRFSRLDYIIIPVLLAASGCFLFSNPRQWLYIVIFSLSLVWGLIVLFLYFYVPGRNFKAEPKFKNEYHLTFSKSGINFVTDDIYSDLGWGIYNSVMENDDFYYLIQARQIYTIIPKRAFASEEQRQLFDEIVKAGLSSANFDNKEK